MHLNLNKPEDLKRLHEMLAQDTAFVGLRRTLFQMASETTSDQACQPA